MANDQKPAAPKAPVKKVTINPANKKDESELDEAQLKNVSGGIARRKPTTKAAACTCSNMPSDPTT